VSLARRDAAVYPADAACVSSSGHATCGSARWGFSLFGNRAVDINPLLAVLRQRGATFQRLETWGDEGEWKFSCAIPNRQNPAIRRT
jgi:hypothetical protein